MRSIAVALVCWSVACVSDAPPSPAQLSARPPDALAAGTALIVVNLHEDGQLDITNISPRPIAFRKRGPSYDPARHGARPLPEPPRTTSPTGPDLGGLDPQGPSNRRDPVPPLEPGRGPCVLVVRHADMDPVVVSLALGEPGEGGGDVTDRWADGSVILRAPYFGPGSHYTVVRVGPKRSVALAEAEAQP